MFFHVSVQKWEKSLYFNTRVHELNAFDASVCLRAKHNTGNNVWLFLFNDEDEVFVELFDFTFTSLKQHHSQWAGQHLCASAPMSKRKVPWRKTLGHRTLPTQRLVPTFTPEQKKKQLHTLHKTTWNHCFQLWCACGLAGTGFPFLAHCFLLLLPFAGHPGRAAGAVCWLSVEIREARAHRWHQQTCDCRLWEEARF